MEPRRRLLFAGVPPARAAACLRALDAAGWSVQAESADGPDELAAALRRPGWDAVIHAAELPGALPAAKALAIVRLADAHLPVVSIDTVERADEIGTAVRGAMSGLVTAVPEHLAWVLERELDIAARGRGSGTAHRLLAAQQGVADHLAAGPDPDELLRRVLATLGETLGWCFGAAWRPRRDSCTLTCAATWHDGDSRIAGFASLSRSWAFAPGNGLPGRVWAFHRPIWIADVHAEGGAARSQHAVRAGLGGATAFPVAAGETLLGVAELWSREPMAPDPEVSALCGAVGRQVGVALARWERQRAERRRLELLLRAAAGTGAGAR